MARVRVVKKFARLLAVVFHDFCCRDCSLSLDEEDKLRHLRDTVQFGVPCFSPLLRAWTGGSMHAGLEGRKVGLMSMLGTSTYPHSFAFCSVCLSSLSSGTVCHVSVILREKAVPSTEKGRSTDVISCLFLLKLLLLPCWLPFSLWFSLCGDSTRFFSYPLF